MVMKIRSKRAQFFILSAVIIASIIVSMASVKNYVITGNAPRQFYYSSQQLESETGAVVDYVFFNNANSDNMTDFFEKGVNYSFDGNSQSEILMCYLSSGILTCQNRGSSSILVFDKVENDFIFVLPTAQYSSGDVGDSVRVKIVSSGKEYSIPIVNKEVSENQFYFVFRVNSSFGEFVDVSGDMQKELG